MCVIFKHAHVKMHSLYLGNTSMPVKSISEKLGSIEVKGAHLTSVCPFPKDGGRAQRARSSAPHRVQLPLLSASALVGGSCWRSFGLHRCILQ